MIDLGASCTDYRKPVSVEGFEHYRPPARVALQLELEPPKARQYILRCPIMVDGENFRVPEELEWVRPMLNVCINFQRSSVKIWHTFCYVTVRHGVVDSVTDDEWHVDGFSTRISVLPEHSYIWSNRYPTEVSTLSGTIPHGFDPLKHNINYLFQDILSRYPSIPSFSGEEKEVLQFDPYLVHRRPPESSGKQRTFVRISFVPIEINNINNSQNPLIPRVYTRDGVKDFRDKLKRFPVYE